MITAKPYDKCIFYNDYRLRRNQSLTINNITSKLNLRVVSSPKSPQIQCRSMLIASIVCRATVTPQKVYTRTDRKFRVNRLSVGNFQQSKVTFAVFNSSFDVVRGNRFLFCNLRKRLRANKDLSVVV